MRKTPAASVLYNALFELSAMRTEVRGFGAAISRSQAARLLSQIAAAELTAGNLLDACEAGRVPSH
ncbi:MAG: hypothetical protein M3Q69_19575 [Acidobacteriota bacterium]|nr:hypothetical protein [Acidobacteriota bacterium]